MQRLKTILAIAGISFLFSCLSNIPYPEAMQKAIHCMEEHPDSALVYLSSLDSVIQYEPKETQMYYGLLVTQAKDKEYIQHTSDSLMQEIVHFYESYGDTDKLMEAYYYLGSVYRDMKDAPHAVTAFQQAVEAGKNSLRFDILGRTYSQMGTLLAYQSLYKEALKIYKISYAYSLKQEDGPGLVYAFRNQGRMYEYLKQLDSAEYYYQAAYKKAFEINNQRIIKSLSIELGSIYLNFGKIDSAKKVFSRISGSIDDAIYLQALAEIFQLTSQPDSAQFYYLKALQEGKQNLNIYLKSNSYKALAKLEAQKRNYHSAYNYIQKSLEFEDTIKYETRTKDIAQINALYNYRHTEKVNHRLLWENEHKRNQIYVLIIGLLTIAGVAILYTNYTRKQRWIAQEQAKRLSMLRDEQYKNSWAYIRENEMKITVLEAQLQQTEGEKNTLQKELIRSQKELLEISNQRIEIGLNEKDCLEASLRQSDVYQLFHQAVHQEDKLKSITEESWKQLQHHINLTYNNFTEQLYVLCPQISEQELRICYLIKIRIQTKDIAKILSRTLSAISNSRTRLYKKIHGEEGKAEMLDNFIIDL